MDAYTAALTLLSRRELSTEQLRERLQRRRFAPDDIDAVVQRLSADGTLNDRRVAVARARTELVLKHHGRRRVLQRVQQLGIDPDTARLAVDEVFDEVDEASLLDAAIEKRLRGASIGSLDVNARAKLMRHLVGRGFEPSRVMTRLRRKGVETDE